MHIIVTINRNKEIHSYFTEKCIKKVFLHCIVNEVCFSSTNIIVTMVYQWQGRWSGGDLPGNSFITRSCSVLNSYKYLFPAEYNKLFMNCVNKKIKQPPPKKNKPINNDHKDIKKNLYCIRSIL